MEPLDFKSQSGFTMIELIVVMVISGIMASALGQFIAGPMREYRRNVARAELVASAEDAFRRMQRDVHRALPNSVRVVGGGLPGNSFELLHVADGGRYRGYPSAYAGAPVAHDVSQGEDILTTGFGDGSFNIQGQLSITAPPLNAGPPPFPEWRVAVYPTNDIRLYQDIEENDGGLENVGIITGNQTTIDFTDDDCAPADPVLVPPGPCPIEEQVTLIPPFEFDIDKEGTSRLYIVDTPITYHCAGPPNELHREWHYTPRQAQVAVPAGAQKDAVMADNLDPAIGCLFTYRPGNSQRSGMLTAMLRVQANSGSGGVEAIELVHQIRVVNAP